MSQVCGKVLVGQSWHVHHCVQEKETLHGQSHSCPCGHEWTTEEQLTLTPYTKVRESRVGQVGHGKVVKPNLENP